MKRYQRFMLHHFPVVLLLLSLLTLMKKLNVQNDPKFDSVIILGKARTGSTLLTTLLNVNDVLYFKEPIFEITRTANIQINHSSVIADLLTCNLKPFYWGKFLVQSSIIDDLCNLQSARFPCQLTLKLFHKLCNLSKFKVIKTIQLNFEAAAAAIESSKMKTAILYLVRDPRAILASRTEFLKTASLQVMDTNPKVLCGRIKSELEFLCMDNLKVRFFLVKYEELVLYPTRVVRNIYKFLGRKYSPSVTAIVKAKLEIKPEKTNFLNLISTERDSKSRLELWREVLPYEKVSEIQNDCREVMEKLNYSLIYNRQELRNNSLKLY